MRTAATAPDHTERIEDTLLSSEQVLERLRARGLEPRWSGRPPERLADVADDSRRVGPGGIFCAVRGLRHDGHDFLEEAREAGAAAAVVERVDPAVDLPQLEVADSRLAAAHLAELFRGDPSAALRVFGVTGTNGKTTVAWLLRHVLAAEAPAGTVGTLGVVGPGGERRPGDLTTPGPVEVSRALAELRDDGARYAAVEVSSHALDQRRVDGLSFRGMAFTNLSREHLEYHDDMESYRRAKLRAAELVVPGGVCAADAGEPAWEGLDPGEAGRVTFGLEGEGADVEARRVEADADGSRWRLAAADAGEAPVRLPLPGRFNVRNALAAAALGLSEGIGVEAVAARLSDAPQVPGRMEVLARSPALVIRDYAHTPDALERVLRALRPADGRLAVVFGCGGERDVGKRPMMGRVAGELADLALVTTDNPRSEDPAEIAAQVVEGLEGAGDGPRAEHEVVLDRRAAIARALERAGPGDVVLLAGKGHEDYQLVGDRREPFDEAGVVRELTAGGDGR